MQTDDIESDEDTYAPKRKRTGPSSSISFQILLGVLIALIVAGGIFYFVSKRSTTGEGSPLEAKLTALEQRMAQLENQVAEVQGKVGAAGSDPGLVQRLDALTQKVEAIEKKKQPPAETKVKPSSSSKPAVSAKKQVHTVQKGETLGGISKKYGIGMEELRKLNNLSAGQPLRPGQKLVVSPQH